MNLKSLTPIVIALISLATAVFVAIIQQGSAKESTLKALVDQLNQDTIPRIQDSLGDIRERLAKLEVKADIVFIPKIRHYSKLFTGKPEEKNTFKSAMTVTPLSEITIPKLEMLDEK